MSSLRDLFESCTALLAAGLRGPQLAAAFRERFDVSADRHLAELQELVAASLRHLGLSAWAGGRLGWDYMEFGRLDDRDAVERLALSLVAASEPDDSGLGWLAGPLFRGGRLLGYLTAAEEEGEKALAFLRRNLSSELQRLRDAADPVGAALFYNLKASAAHAADEATLAWSAPQLVLARGTSLRAPEDGSSKFHAEVLAEHGALAPFASAVQRNEQREEGKRNSPLRGPAFEEPLVEHFVAWAEGPPPACQAVHVGRLSNRLRTGFPPPESLREARAPVDSEGHDLLETFAQSPEKLVADGPEDLLARFQAWREALAQAPGLGDSRREKLGRILSAVERLSLDHLGELPAGWTTELRLELGIKPQTFSDDLKHLKELCPLAGGVNR